MRRGGRKITSRGVLILAGLDGVGGLDEGVLGAGVWDTTHLQRPGLFIVLVFVQVLVDLKVCRVVVDADKVLACELCFLLLGAG